MRSVHERAKTHTSTTQTHTRSPSNWNILTIDYCFRDPNNGFYLMSSSKINNTHVLPIMFENLKASNISNAPHQIPLLYLSCLPKLKLTTYAYRSVKTFPIAINDRVPTNVDVRMRRNLFMAKRFDSSINLCWL